MSEPIKAGDLVMVVRWPCCGVAVGRIWRVATFYSRPEFLSCSKCGTELPNEAHPMSDGVGVARHSAPASWVKRIPPLDELDDVKRDEEITA